MSRGEDKGGETEIEITEREEGCAASKFCFSHRSSGMASHQLHFLVCFLALVNVTGQYTLPTGFDIANVLEFPQGTFLSEPVGPLRQEHLTTRGSPHQVQHFNLIVTNTKFCNAHTTLSLFHLRVTKFGMCLPTSARRTQIFLYLPDTISRAHRVPSLQQE